MSTSPILPAVTPSPTTTESLKRPASYTLGRVLTSEPSTRVLNTSKDGMVFHILTSTGKLRRRGIVLADLQNHYLVAWVDPLTGLPLNQQYVLKSTTATWKWFDDVGKSNAAYRNN